MMANVEVRGERGFLRESSREAATSTVGLGVAVSPAPTLGEHDER